MGIYDRDWYRKTYEEKEKKYGKDFSSNARGNNEASDGRDRNNNKATSGADDNASYRNRESSNAGSGQDHYAYGHAWSSTNSIPCSFGDDPQDSSNVISLGVCPKCYNMFRVRTPKHALYNYNYSCPACGQKINVMSDKPKTKGKSIGTKLFFGVGIVCWILIILVFAISLLTKYWPAFEGWIQGLLG